MESITGKHRASNKIRSWSELGMRIFWLDIIKRKINTLEHLKVGTTK